MFVFIAHHIYFTILVWTFISPPLRMEFNVDIKGTTEKKCSNVLENKREFRESYDSPEMFSH